MNAARLWNNVDNVTVDESSIVDDIKRYQSALVELQNKLVCFCIRAGNIYYLNLFPELGSGQESKATKIEIEKIVAEGD